MRKRLIRAVVFVAVSVGAAVGAAGAAGALDSVHGDNLVGSGIHWE